MKKKMILGALAILMLLPVHAQIAWKQVEPGVWKGVVGTPEDYSLLDVAAVTPLKESFARLPEVALPALANGREYTRWEDLSPYSFADKRTTLRLWIELSDCTSAW